MQIYLNSPKENWIIDRIKEEWAQYNQKHNSKKPKTADIFWIIAPWTWKKIKIKDLENKKIVCSIYHIDEDKLDNSQLNEFHKRDGYVDFYHVISEKTKAQVRSLTDKPIQSIPFWVNQNIWFEIENKYDLKKKYGIDKDTYCIGSFQRDTEGSDLISPKLSPLALPSISEPSCTHDVPLQLKTLTLLLVHPPTTILLPSAESSINSAQF